MEECKNILPKAFFPHSRSGLVFREAATITTRVTIDDKLIAYCANAAVKDSETGRKSGVCR